jgi:hypothetical protein
MFEYPTNFAPNFGIKTVLCYKILKKIPSEESLPLRSVGDSQDPNVFGPPGSGSISQRYGSESGSFHFLKGVERIEIMVAK